MSAAVLIALAAVIQLTAGILSLRTAKSSAWPVPWTIITFGMFLACAASLYHLIDISITASRGNSDFVGYLMYLVMSLIVLVAIYSLKPKDTDCRYQRGVQEHSCEELHRLLDALPDCVLQVDRKGLVKGWYPAHNHSLICKSGDSIGRPFTQLLPTELVRTIQPELAKVFRANKPHDFVTCVTVNGESIDLEVRLVPMVDSEAVIVIGDITSEIRAREALQTSEARLMATIENLPFDFFSIDADGRYDLQNATCRRHWGDVIGKRPEDISPDEETCKMWTDNNRRAFSGEAVEGEVEYTVGGEKGYFYNIIAPIRQDDDISGITGVNIDITERKRAEQALRESEAKFKALVEESLMGVYLIQDDCVLYINPKIQEILGYEPEDYIGRPFLEKRIHPDDKEMVKENIRKRFDGEISSMHYTIRMIAKDGSVKHTEVYGTCTSYQGKPAIIGTMIDVTERLKEQQQKKQLRETLDRAEKMEAVGILAGGVAHELNNILGPVVAYPEIISKKLPDDSPVKKQVDLIGKSAREAARIIRDLITLARRDHYEMITTSLNTVVRTYLDSPDFEKLMMKNRRVNVEKHLDKDLPAISGCASHLVKVVMNLVGDAVAAMPEGGKVIISTSHMHLDHLLSGYAQIEPGDYAILKISDTGEEIPEEDLKRIFEPYFTRGHNARRHSGLNLAVIYGIVKDHDGYYDVFSSAETGTDFLLYFPVKPVTARPDGVTQDDLSGSESILIVDDSEELCEIAQEVLETHGYRVAVAGSGREAVEYLRHHSADLVVLDMIMEEDFDGLDTYRQMLDIRADQKAIIVSAYSASERVRQLQQLGVGQYVRKPYSAEVLARAVRKELDRQPSVSPA